MDLDATAGERRGARRDASARPQAPAEGRRAGTDALASAAVSAEAGPAPTPHLEVDAAPARRAPHRRRAEARLPTLGEHLVRSRTSVLVLAGAVLAMFMPTVLTSYGFSDDYTKLWMAVSGQRDPYFGASIFRGDASEWRPLAGLANQAAFDLAGSIDHLRFVRLLAIIGIVGLGVLLQWALVRARMQPMASACVAVVVCSMPAFQVVASWAVMCMAPYAAIFGGSASLVAMRAVSRSPRVAWRTLLVSTLLLAAALLTYQPSAMFFWVFLAVAVAGAAYEARSVRHLVVVHAAVGVAGLAAAYVIARSVASVLGDPQTENAGRATLTHDPVGKLQWFLGAPIERSLSLFALTPSMFIELTVVVLSLGGSVLWLRRHRIRPLPYLLVALALVPLAFLPNLLAQENNTESFRTGIALTSLLVLYAAFGVSGLASLVYDALVPQLNDRGLSLARNAAAGAALLVAAGAAVTASDHVLTLMAVPQSTELRLVRSQVDQFPHDLARVGFVQIGWDSGMVPWYSDELGLPSMARPWAGGPMVLLALHEDARRAQGATAPTVQWFPLESRLPPDLPVVDLRGQLKRLR